MADVNTGWKIYRSKIRVKYGSPHVLLDRDDIPVSISGKKPAMLLLQGETITSKYDNYDIIGRFLITDEGVKVADEATCPLPITFMINPTYWEFIAPSQTKQFLVQGIDDLSQYSISIEQSNYVNEMGKPIFEIIDKKANYFTVIHNYHTLKGSQYATIIVKKLSNNQMIDVTMVSNLNPY